MCALRKTYIFVGVLLLSSGPALANDTGIAVPDMPPSPVQAAPAGIPAMAPLTPMWPQMMAVPGPQYYYVMPQPGMGWPMLPQYPQYPVPMMMPPFVWMMVPVQTAASIPAGVDYGPVAATPVVELPLPDASTGSVMSDGADLTVMADKEALGPTADGSAMERPLSADQDSPGSAAGKAEPIAEPAAASLSVVELDYGPVAPTPVVDLLALQRPVPVASPPKRLRASSKPARESGAATQPKPRPTTVTQPVKKRMCWTKGVVAPCR